MTLLSSALEELGRERGEWIRRSPSILIPANNGVPASTWSASARKRNTFRPPPISWCAYLTGMRDSEVQAMGPGCLRRERSADGLIERLWIRSTIFKHRGPRGDLGEWITIEPVGRALQVAEKLAERHHRPNGDKDLWLGLDVRSRAPTRGIRRIVEQLNRFRAHVDRQHGESEASIIPKVDGRSWWFTTPQFRRTAAWYIANRPFGVIAGKIQYKHASVAMFEGYAGSSSSGFRQEVEQERVLGQLDDIVEHFEAHRRGERQAGPASVRLGREYDHATRALAPLSGQIVDQKRLRAMLGHLARTLHVGYLNDCFFEPAVALCLIDDRNETEGAPDPVTMRAGSVPKLMYPRAASSGLAGSNHGNGASSRRETAPAAATRGAAARK